MNTTKRIIFSALILILAFSSYSLAYEYEYTAGDVIVVFDNSRVTASSLLNSVSVTKIYAALSSKAGNHTYALIHSDDIDPEEFTKELLRNPNVIAASPNYIVRAAVVPDDTYMSDLWGMNAINMPSAWDKEKGSNSVYVAIVDSGIDWTNPELSTNTAKSLGFTASAISSSQPGFDNYGHGTHVAGTIGASGNNGAGVAGINWYVRMIPVKVLDSRGSGTTDTVIEGMNYIASLMQEGYNVRAINLSLETYINMKPEHDNLVVYPMWRAFKEIDEYNQAIIVCAAGNEGVVTGQPTTKSTPTYSSGSYVYPASFTGLNNMLSVSAVNGSGEISSYSNTNASISAPGGDINRDGSGIVSTWLQNSTYLTSEGIALRRLYGTSMAAPHVSGAAALLAAHDSSMTAYQIKQCLLRSVSSYGEGMLDVDAALRYQEYYGASLSSEGTEDYGYENWNNNSTHYDPYEPYYPYDENNNSSSSGGCNGFMLAGFAVIMILPLARKFMS